MNNHRKSEPKTLKEEQAKIEELRSRLGPLSERENIFCTDDCLHRYLRARNWNVKKSERMLKDTLKWRREFRPEEIKWEHVSKEAETGKMYRTSFSDKMGRSVLVLAPGRQNTNDHNNQIRHLVYCLEDAVTMLPEGSEQMVWLIDYRGWTLRMSPPLRTSLETLNILQNHYPERLGLAILYDPPPFFRTFWTMIKPFLDPKTYQKIKFVYPSDEASMSVIREAFDLDCLEKGFGGNSSWAYDHDTYGKMMQQDDAKAAKRWRLNHNSTC